MKKKWVVLIFIALTLLLSACTNQSQISNNGDSLVVSHDEISTSDIKKRNWNDNNREMNIAYGIDYTSIAEFFETENMYFTLVTDKTINGHGNIIMFGPDDFVLSSFCVFPKSSTSKIDFITFRSIPNNKDYFIHISGIDAATGGSVPIDEPYIFVDENLRGHLTENAKKTIKQALSEY